MDKQDEQDNTKKPVKTNIENYEMHEKARKKPIRIYRIKQD